MLAAVMLTLILNATFFYSDNDNLTQFMFKKNIITIISGAKNGKYLYIYLYLC